MRSGSTLLGMVLNSTPGFFSVGELRWFWSHANSGHKQCGCGETVLECPFWSDVISDLKKAGIDIPRLAALTPRLTRTGNMPTIWARKFNPSTGRKWEELLAATQQLYQAVSNRCGGNIIVDGSKIPPQLMLLQEMQSVDLRILHLVRDGRGVAYSWEKRAARAIKKKRGPRAKHRSAYNAMAVWMIQNFLLDRISRQHTYRTLIQYEDFATNPESTLLRSLKKLDLEIHLTIPESREIILPETHSLGGSPKVRSSGTHRKIVLDDEWRHKMKPVTRIILSLVGLVWLRRYGYRF